MTEFMRFKKNEVQVQLNIDGFALVKTTKINDNFEVAQFSDGQENIYAMFHLLDESCMLIKDTTFNKMLKTFTKRKKNVKK